LSCPAGLFIAVDCCLGPAGAAASTISNTSTSHPVIVATPVLVPTSAPEAEKASSGGGSRVRIEVIVPVVAGTFTVLGVLITASYTLGNGGKSGGWLQLQL
jgi:hypothetical protein